MTQATRTPVMTIGDQAWIRKGYLPPLVWSHKLYRWSHLLWHFTYEVSSLNWLRTVLRSRSRYPLP